MRSTKTNNTLFTWLEVSVDNDGDVAIAKILDIISEVLQTFVDSQLRLVNKNYVSSQRGNHG